jgi:tetratricopeptide (TPR) repeat protein
MVASAMSPRHHKHDEPAAAAPRPRMAVPADELVRDFLHGQNLEQIGKVDEATALYERAVEAGFDAAGPYDRLLFIYQQRRQFKDVIRVAEASLRSVRTYEAKRMWYQQYIKDAQSSIGAPPRPLPR